MRFHCAVFATTLATNIFAYDSVPDWVSSAPALTDPAMLGAANAVVRRADTLVSVEADGTFVTERRIVVEILRNEGSSLAQDSESYNAASDKVIEASAWIVRQGREVEQKSKREWTDLAANAEGAIIDETRRIAIDLSYRAVKGDLIVFATTIRTREFLGDHFFGYAAGTIPRASMIVQFTLPPGW